MSAPLLSLLIYYNPVQIKLHLHFLKGFFGNKNEIPDRNKSDKKINGFKNVPMERVVFLPHKSVKDF